MAYDYDAAGNRAHLTTRNGGSVQRQDSYAYDGKSRLVSIADSKLGTFSFAYDPMDRRTSLTYPNGMVTSYAYDKAYRLTAMVSKTSAGAVADAGSKASVLMNGFLVEANLATGDL